MPELPEVEVVRRGLAEHVVGRRVVGLSVLDARSLRRHLPGPEDFAARLQGRTVVAAHRRGKYLWLALDSHDAVLAHLGMSGHMLISSPDADDPRHVRVRIDLDNDTQLRFCDQRLFGGLDWAEGGAELPAQITHIARDPLDPECDEELFFARLRRRDSSIKRALLDQSLISGIGNIYADEALWRTRLHFARNARTLRRTTAQELLDNIRSVMSEALEEGGTSFDRLYVNINGASGYFDRSLNAYGQEALPCGRCGTPIRRDAFMNRSSFTCPRCQPRPRNGRW